MRHWLRFAFGRVALLGAVALAVGLPTLAPAQSPPTDANSPARFVRGDHALFYLEFDGLDAHADAWKQTAAYRILNETPTGAMLEDLFRQLVARSPVASTISGDEMVILIKHFAQAGFTIAVNPIVNPDETKQGGAAVFVLRGAFSNKAVAPIVARLLQKLPSPDSKMTSVVKSGHKVIAGKAGRSPFFWWVEETKKADVLVVSGPSNGSSIDFVLDAVDGRAPSILTNPIRTELARSRDGFERVGMAFFDPNPLQGGDGSDIKVLQALENAGIKRVDLAMGFQGDALMTITRVHPTDPGKVAAALGQTFERGSLPNFPSNSYAFLASAANLKGMPALLRADPTSGPKYEQAAAELKAKAKIRLDEDVFGQLGPKVMMVLAPSKAAESGGGGGLLALARLGAGGGDALPKLALLLDVADSKAFGKTLDELVGYFNREIKAQVARQMAEIVKANPPPPGRGAPPSPPTPEFRPMTSGDGKSYVLYIPPEIAKSIPANLRPAIRLGGKQLAVATSADAARQVLEGKGNYTPPPELADGFNRLPSQLNGLMFFDTRSITPETLAALPGKIQQAAALAGMLATPNGGPPPAPLTFQIDPSKLPSADAVRKLLFPSVYTVDRDGDAVRITTRAPFPPMPDPAFLLGLTLPAIQAARAAAIRQQGGAPGAMPKPPTDGFFDVPKSDGEAPKGPPGAPPTGPRPLRRGGPGMERATPPQ